jgi:copper chaperone CopZ
MKAKHLLAMLLMLIGIALPASAKKKAAKTTVFHVEMTCQNCINNIEKNVSWEKGVTDLVCDLKAQTVTITYNPDKTDDAKLIAAFKKIGKDASVETPKHADSEKSGQK